MPTERKRAQDCRVILPARQSQPSGKRLQELFSRGLLADAAFNPGATRKGAAFRGAKQSAWQPGPRSHQQGRLQNGAGSLEVDPYAFFQGIDLHVFRSRNAKRFHLRQQLADHVPIARGRLSNSINSRRLARRIHAPGKGENDHDCVASTIGQ